MKISSRAKGLFFVGLFLISALLIFLQLSGFALLGVPALKQRVNDLSGTLTSAQIENLEAKLNRLEREKGSQIFVLIVPTSAPEELSQFSIRVAEEWKAGRKGIDDGVILIVARSDRALRIEVGRGLEGAIPDVLAKRIIEQIILPQFRAGDFYAGIEKGINAIAALIASEPLPKNSGASEPTVFIGPLFIVGIIVAGLLTAIGLSSTLSGILVGGTAALLAILLAIPIWFSILLGLIIFLIALGRGSGGGFSRRSGSGGSYRGAGGGWSSGGGFMGGDGGGFSGGGASGKW